MNNRIYGFTYNPFGSYSKSFNIILASSEDEARAKAYSYLKALQSDKMNSNLWYAEDWENLDDLYVDVFLLTLNDSVGNIGEYVE